MQGTFLYAFRALERGVIPEAELPWILAIARNVCLARHRTRGRRRERETLRDPVLLQDLSAAPEPSESLVGIDDALALLPETQRRAILLREWRGLSYREIAAELGLSGAAVETLIFRARRSLAEQLDGERAEGRRRALRGLDLGSAAAAFKSLLGTGIAAKLAVAAATVATVVAVRGETPPLKQPPAPPPPAVQEVVPAARTAERVIVGQKVSAPVRERKAKRQPKAERTAVQPPASIAPAESDAVDPIVGVAEEAGTVAQVLPDLPVVLPEAPELAAPGVPLP